MRTDMAPKADTALGLSAFLAVINTWLVNANEWFAANMSLVGGLCLIVSTSATIWYYREMRNQKIRDRALEHERHEFQVEMHRRSTDAPGERHHD